MLCRYLISMIWYLFLMMKLRRSFRQKVLICRSKSAMKLNFREKSGILTVSMRTEEESCSHVIRIISLCRRKDWKRSCLRWSNMLIVMQILKIRNSIMWIFLIQQINPKKLNRNPICLLLMCTSSIRKAVQVRPCVVRQKTQRKQRKSLTDISRIGIWSMQKLRIFSLWNRKKNL